MAATIWNSYSAAGKTTLLRYLLEQNEEKIGCIVNDVASEPLQETCQQMEEANSTNIPSLIAATAGINIDAKLIRNDRNKDRSSGPNTTSDLADTVELANGCACEDPGFSTCHCPFSAYLRAFSPIPPSPCRLQHPG